MRNVITLLIAVNRHEKAAAAKAFLNAVNREPFSVVNNLSTHVVSSIRLRQMVNPIKS
jgi:hypothetical protein